jgi:hypothetical protein
MLHSCYIVDFSSPVEKCCNPDSALGYLHSDIPENVMVKVIMFDNQIWCFLVEKKSWKCFDVTHFWHLLNNHDRQNKFGSWKLFTYFSSEKVYFASYFKIVAFIIYVLISPNQSLN